MNYVVAKYIQKQVKKNEKKEISRNRLPASAGFLFVTEDGHDMFL
jgi:hypothetical protein